MQTKITLLLVLLITSLSFAQNKKYEFLESKSDTKIIYDNVFSVSKITKEPKEIISANYLKQVFHEIQRADALERLPKYNQFKALADNYLAKKQIPLAILISDFEYLQESVLVSNDFENKTSQELFQKKSIALMAPLALKTKTNRVDFILDESMVFNTTSKSIAAIRVKFTDVAPWRILPFNQVQHITFEHSGKQQITFEITFNDGTKKQILSSIEVPPTSLKYRRNSDDSIQAIEDITATIPYQGFGETAAVLGQGEYEIFLDNVDQVLDKPIFLIDGFDPGDTRNSTLIYELLNFGTEDNLANSLRDLGYDIIVLNFPSYTVGTNNINGGADFIQRNAFVLVELLNQINTQKVGSEQNVVIGPSMGGLIARYALRYMEMNNIEHDTRLYISFDSPHLGANVPIGFQHLFNYMANGPLGDVTLQEIVNTLFKSPAARQMLLDHFEGHLQTGSTTEFSSTSLLPIGAPNFRNAFQSELDAMGMPQNTRNVAISNGSNNGMMTGTPGMTVMDYTLNVTAAQRAIINLKFTPAANATNQVSRFRGQQNIIFWITIFESLANAQSPASSAGYDSAPGGTFDIEAFAEGAAGDPTLEAFLNNLLIDKFCFIPTLSSLAITNPNWYAPVTSSSSTPFVNTFVPTENESHVTLSEGNIAFTLNEILNAPLSLSEQFALNDISVGNPIKNSLELYSQKEIVDAQITIMDMSGKTMFTANSINIIGNQSIPIHLSTGFYLLTIKTVDASVTKKLIKN